MSKILIVEPQRMLQHAMVAALAPEHRVRLTAELGNPIEASEYDAVIVDVAALQEAARWNTQMLGFLQNLPMPTVLIEGREAVEISARAGLARVTAPFSRDALKTALRESLGGVAGAEPSAVETARPKRASRPAAPKKQKAEETPGAAAQDHAGVIELTEVVEED